MLHLSTLVSRPSKAVENCRNAQWVLAFGFTAERKYNNLRIQ